MLSVVTITLSLSSKLLSISPIYQFVLHLLVILSSHPTDNSSLYNQLKKFSNSSEPLCATLDLGLSWVPRPTLSNSSFPYSELYSSITTSLFLTQSSFHQTDLLNWRKPISRLAWIGLRDGAGAYFVEDPLHRFRAASIWGLFLLSIM